MLFINQTRLRSLLKQRLGAIASQVEKINLDAFLVSSKTNRYYLTGWQGDAESGFCLITKKENYYISDSRYGEHITKATNFVVIESNSGIGLSLGDLTEKLKIGSIGFESPDLSVFLRRQIKRHLKGVRLVPVEHLIETQRSVKDKLEIEFIKKSSSIADKAFKHIKNFIKPGMKETEVAWELEKYMREIGADGVAWSPFIVAAGKNSSMAHWGAGETKIKKGDMVQLDYGCSYGGYTCDMSRAVFLGEPYKKKRAVYNLVFEAQQTGLNLVKASVEAATIDEKVHEFMARNRPGWLRPEYIYKHSLGHGVGLDVHELPYVSASRKSKLEVGNVITIEPGIYIPGWGGVRIEDTVLVTKAGHKLLTKTPKGITKTTI